MHGNPRTHPASSGCQHEVIVAQTTPVPDRAQASQPRSVSSLRQLTGRGKRRAAGYEHVRDDRHAPTQRHWPAGTVFARHDRHGAEFGVNGYRLCVRPVILADFLHQTTSES